MDIGVIGGGTAGNAAAILLARAGHAVTVYERVEAPLPVGAGIVLQPSGLSVLHQLGLYDAAVARGSRLRRLHAVTAAGRTVIDLGYEEVMPGAFGLGIHRGVLFELLFRAARAEPNVRFHCGVCVEDLRDDRGRRQAIEAGTGRALGTHDLIVVADGARSRLRDDTAVHKRIRPYAWGALWFIGDGAPGDTLHQVVEGTRRLLGLLPTGLGPTGETAKTTLFWSIRCDRVAAWRAAGLAPWKQELLRLAPASAPLLAQIQAPEQVLHSSYVDVVMRPWNTESVVYLGDAAHAMSPQLGQGANLALVDAWTLADCLSRGRPLLDSLNAYSRERQEHLDFYQLATRWLTPFFQSDLVPLGWARDLAMGTACRLPWVRGQMVRSMCGVSRGPHLPALPLPGGLARLPAPGR